MPLDDQTKLAFSSVVDLTKQLITLGTAVITLEVTFGKSFSSSTIEKHWQLGWSWGLLLLSVIGGIAVLMAIAGSIAEKTALTPGAIYDKNIKYPAFLQIITFVGGLILTIWYGLLVAGFFG